MRRFSFLRAAFAVAGILVLATRAGAQPFESVGIRAQGMGGAFIAVADDATATWWNPAGLATGDYFTAILEHDRLQEPAVERDGAGRLVPAWRTATLGFAAAIPSLGVSYYRLRISQIKPAAAIASEASSRQDRVAGDVALGLLQVDQVGVTVGQSVVNHLVVASTVKLLRGSFATEGRAASEASLDRAAGLDGASATKGDLDVGAMAAFGAARVGLTVKNLTQPAFAAGTDRLVLKRQARAGVSITSGPRGMVDGLTGALDVDLTATSLASGMDRRVAAGVETWLLSRRVGVRGGLSVSTMNEARPAGSGGVSVAVRRGMYLDGQATLGKETSRRGWGFDLRVTF